MAMLSNYLRRRDSTDELLAVLSPLRPSAAAQGEIALRRFSRAIVAALGFASAVFILPAASSSAEMQPSAKMYRVGSRGATAEVRADCQRQDRPSSRAHHPVVTPDAGRSHHPMKAWTPAAMLDERPVVKHDIEHATHYHDSCGWIRPRASSIRLDLLVLAFLLFVPTAFVFLSGTDR